MNSRTDKIDKWGNKLGERIQRWVQRDTTFDFLRKTPGRTLLNVATIAALYLPLVLGWGNAGSILTWWPVSLLCIVLLQKLSIRFAFDDDSAIDEFQHKRRNRSYRRAYKRIGTILLAIFGLPVLPALIPNIFGAIETINGRSSWVSSQITNFKFEVLGLDHFLMAFTFIVALFVLQKYLSWGVKGESKN